MNLNLLNERYDWIVKQATVHGKEIIRASMVGTFRRCKRLTSLACKYKAGEDGEAVVDVIAEFDGALKINASEAHIPQTLDPAESVKDLYGRFDTPAGIMVFRHTYGLYCTVHMTRKGVLTLTEDEREYDRTG